jgi:hypothetical protein
MQELTSEASRSNFIQFSKQVSVSLLLPLTVDSNEYENNRRIVTEKVPVAMLCNNHPILYPELTVVLVKTVLVEFDNIVSGKNFHFV